MARLRYAILQHLGKGRGAVEADRMGEDVRMRQSVQRFVTALNSGENVEASELLDGRVAGGGGGLTVALLHMMGDGGYAPIVLLLDRDTVSTDFFP